MNRFRILLACLSLCLPLLASGSVAAKESGTQAAQAKSSLPVPWMKALTWRSIGPGSMGGRITALAVNPNDSTMWWAASASGGLLKTLDNGITFVHQFDHERVVSIGDVAVARSNPKIVWVGTGEGNPRNSVSYGNGVYKSVDGGTSWKHMGLEGTFQTGAVRIHPKDPNVVYVGALGRLWGHNEERGLYKTADGGKTWKKILYVDDKTGVIDVQMHPTDPDTLLVAMWERQRDGFDTNDPAKKWGPGSGLYKTTDGGVTFQRLTKGLPSGQLGRIGIEYYAKNPDTVFLVLESEKIGTEPANAPYMGIVGKDAEVGARLTQIVKKGPAEGAGLKKDDIIIGVEDRIIHSYSELLKAIRSHAAGETVTLQISRARKSVFVELELGKRPVPPKKKGAPPPPGRARPRSPFGAFLGGQRANLQGQQGKDEHEYGGVYKSIDGGESWKRINTVNPRPMYFSEIRVDPSDEQRIWVLGIRLWKSKDGGLTFTGDGHPSSVHVDHHALWIDPENGRHMILGNDGGVYVTYDSGTHYDHLNHMAIGQFYDVAVGPRRNYRVYGGLQDNGSWGGPCRVGSGAGPRNEDWVRIAGGDGFRCRVDPTDPDQIYFESQNGAIGRRHLRSGERASLRPRAPKGTSYRFNWYTPFVLSQHNSRIYYTAGNKIFRSIQRGDKMRAISPDITATKRGSATALAESPLDERMLWVGTDDGGLWMTRDGGGLWTDLYAPKAPTPALKKKGPAHKNAHAMGRGDAAANGKKKPKPADSKKKAVESAPSPRAQRLLDRMLRMDANGDGALQREEVPEESAGLFLRLDKNEDGVLDRAELLSLLARGRGRREAKGPVGKTKTPPATSPLATLQPQRRWVSWIEPSRFEAGRVYVVFDGHRSDDDRAHVYVTEDHGASWRSLTGALPSAAGTTRVLQEDLENPDLLYLGTEFGAWVSIDRGLSWAPLGGNLPTVAVHAFAQHQSAGEIVAGTHGRSLWILDVTALRQISPQTVAADVTLYRPGAAIQWRPEPRRGGTRSFVGSNPPAGAHLYYSLGKKARTASLEIRSIEGELLQTLKAPSAAGLHHLSWNLRGKAAAGPAGRRRRFAARVKPGRFQAVLIVDGKSHTQLIEVAMDPAHPEIAWMEHEDEAERAAAEKAEKKSKRDLPHDRGREE